MLSTTPKFPLYPYPFYRNRPFLIAVKEGQCAPPRQVPCLPWPCCLPPLLFPKMFPLLFPQGQRTTGTDPKPKGESPLKSRLLFLVVSGRSGSGLTSDLRVGGSNPSGRARFLRSSLPRSAFSSSIKKSCIFRIHVISVETKLLKSRASKSL